MEGIRIMNWIPALTFTILFCMLLTRCDTHMDIQREYDYSVTLQKYHETLPYGHSCILVFEMKREGNYENAVYYVQYFQSQGTGTLVMGDKRLYENTDYQIIDPDLPIKLSYTSLSGENEKMEILITDNFGNKKEINVTFKK